MFSFNAVVQGWFEDAYVTWNPVPRDSDDTYGPWQGWFDYNIGWVYSSYADKVLLPGQYTIYEEASEYAIEVESVEPQAKNIYRVKFRSNSRQPSRRTWSRARDLNSVLSSDQQIQQRIEAKSRGSGCLLSVLAIGVTLVVGFTALGSLC